MFKKIKKWLKEPFFKKSPDADKIVSFKEAGINLGNKPGLVFIVVLLIILAVELPLRAEAFVAPDYRLIWLAASLVGLLFYLLFRFISNEKVDFLATLYMTVNTSDVIYGLVFGAIAILWALILNFTFNALFDSVYGNIFENKALYQGINLILAILSAGFVRPVGEELLFRQFFLKRNINKFGEMAGLIINGLIFGIRTVDPFFFFVNFGIGVLFAYGAKKYSLKTAIFSSIFFNISIILIIILFGGK